MVVDGIRLDPNNEEFMKALVLAQSTDKNLYITGKAGSGKTFFLKYLKSVCSKDLAVLAPTTEDGDKRVISVAREVWKSVKYIWNDEEGCVVEETVGRFDQFPLRLDWAVSVHKSQGLTFERVIADIGDSFASGQAYVALRRCTSFEGLVLLSPVTPTSIRTDPRVLAFAKSETPNDDVIELLYDA